MRKIYAIHITYQRPINAPDYQITDENFGDHLFKAEAYGAYLAFFDKKLETMTIEEAFIAYGTKEPVYDNIHAGLFHPLIHFSYGLEFQEKLVAAEGLALACVHRRDEGFRIPELDGLEYLHLKGKPINEILEDIRNDDVLKKSIKYDVEDYFESISTKEASASLLKHVAHWQVAGKDQSPSVI